MDEYIDLDWKALEAQWKKLKEDNPHGFDVVIEATGVKKLVNESIKYVRRRGSLLLHWPPFKVSHFFFFFNHCRMFSLLIDVLCT